MKFYHSIRWRLQLWMGIILATVLTGFGLVVYQLERRETFSEIDGALAQRLEEVNKAASPMGGGPGPGPGPGGRGKPKKHRRGGPDPDHAEEGRRLPPRFHEHEHDFEDPRAAPSRGDRPDWPDRRRRTLGPVDESLFEEEDGYYFIFYSARKRDVLGKAGVVPEALPCPTPPEDSLSHFRTYARTHRQAYRFNGIGECALVGKPISEELERLDRFAWMLGGGGAGVLLLGLGSGWWLTSHTIRPIKDISTAAQRISTGDLSERIPLGREGNELNELATVLNETFEKLDHSFAKQKQFTGDASHELRTPLAVMISEAQTALSRDRSKEDYKETIAVCLETAQQMSSLTDSLLDLTRLDSGKNTLHCEPLNLAELGQASCERLRPLVEDRGCTLHVEVSDALVEGDASRLTQVITNLISNAWRYSAPGGTIVLRTGTSQAKAFLEVEDTGEGIAEEDLPHLFERFFRADRARSQPAGRTGLGLAICKAIIESHGGTFAVTSTVGEGSTFRFELALASVAKA